ncbi:MAG: LacI family DNA-binding transcriptional regulator [Litorimonas sp.]
MTESRHSVTIKEVAERAGVSLMTVSRVVNDKGLVKDATREKVQKAIEDLNYRPNISARRLAGGKALFVGLVYHNPSPGYLTKILLGSLSACRRNGHHLLLEDLGEKTPDSEPKEMARSLKAAGLDGVIITPPMSNHMPFIEAIEAAGLPVVRVAPDNIHTQKPRIAMDDVLAARQMLQHLVDQGHNRIGFVKGPSDHPSAHHRFEGFASGMAENNLALEDALIHEGDFTYRSGLDAGRALLSLDHPPTAIFASNDDMAAGLVASAHMLGLKVPDDISVAGFDDTELATNIWPELTTIQQPIVEMSRRAVELLIAVIRNDTDTINEHRGLMDFKLMSRDSVQPKD